MKLKQAGDELVIESAGYGAGGINPDLTVLSDGRIVASWVETLPQPTDEFDDTDGGIFVRILDSSGVPVGDVMQVNESTTFAQDRAQVVALQDGSFAVGWTSTAVLGDHLEDADTFVGFFDKTGAAIENFQIDYRQDTAGSAGTGQELLQEIVSLSDGRFAVISEDADPAGVTTRVYDSSGTLNAELGVPSDDIVQLNNGDIVVAGMVEASSDPADGDHVRLTLYDSNFFGPKGIQGQYDPVIFYVDEGRGLNHDLLTQKADNNLELAALTGGGFALAFIDEDSKERSRINLAVLTDELLLESGAPKVTRQIEFNDTNGQFDMIGLSGGGLAMAITTFDGTSGRFGVDILLFDADGTQSSRIVASPKEALLPAAPSLAEMADGTIALSYTEDPAGAGAGAHNPMRLSFFEVTNGIGKFIGSDSGDKLAGVAGNDRINGLAGDDQISGRNGDDRLAGGDGDDILNGGRGNDTLRGNAGRDVLKGQGGNDGLGGGGGNDVLRGGAGNDVLGGGAGNDRLFGDDGADVLKGGLGDDVMTGGNGSDMFSFIRGLSGNDHITDFDATADVIAIGLRGARPAGVAVSTSGGDTLIEFGAASVTLDGVTLTRADIDFDFF